MLALLAQAVSSDAWHDGWQLAVVTFTALTIVVGWLHRQSKSDRAEMTADIRGVEENLTAIIADLRTELKTDIAGVEDRLTANIAEVGGDLKDLKDRLFDDALGQIARYQ